MGTFYLNKNLLKSWYVFCCCFFLCCYWLSVCVCVLFFFGWLWGNTVRFALFTFKWISAWQSNTFVLRLLQWLCGYLGVLGIICSLGSNEKEEIFRLWLFSKILEGSPSETMLKPKVKYPCQVLIEQIFSAFCLSTFVFKYRWEREIENIKSASDVKAI